MNTNDTKTINCCQPFLKKSCPDLSSAKLWIDKWVNQQGQLCKDVIGFEHHYCSRKWMAAFLSGVLENKPLKKFSLYYQSAHGQELLDACAYNEKFEVITDDEWFILKDNHPLGPAKYADIPNSAGWWCNLNLTGISAATALEVIESSQGHCTVVERLGARLASVRYPMNIHSTTG